MISCDNEINSVEEENLKYSLVSPDNFRIANSENELNLKITEGRGKILDVSYIKTDKESVVALIKYFINGEEFTTALVSGIENFKFPFNAIIKFNRLSNDSSETNESDDVYISCVGSSCCAPGGSYDPGTRQFNFHCKCDENGNNSSCIMRVGSKAPEIKE